jgi:hypothetical protein
MPLTFLGKGRRLVVDTFALKKKRSRQSRKDTHHQKLLRLQVMNRSILTVRSRPFFTQKSQVKTRKIGSYSST